jgi:hypothetical protein
MIGRVGLEDEKALAVIPTYMWGHVNEYFVKDSKGWRTNYYGNVL